MKLRLLVFSLAATVMLIGCAGLSTSIRDTGTGASTHAVDLSWAASTSADVSGYKVVISLAAHSGPGDLDTGVLPNRRNQAFRSLRGFGVSMGLEPIH
jgi:hypothetical protein